MEMSNPILVTLLISMAIQAFFFAFAAVDVGVLGVSYIGYTKKKLSYGRHFLELSYCQNSRLFRRMQQKQ